MHALPVAGLALMLLTYLHSTITQARFKSEIEQATLKAKLSCALH